jgi:hypothetical protein
MQEPLVDLGQVVDHVDGVVEVEHRVRDRKQTFEESLQKAIRQVDPRWTGFEAYWQPEDLHNALTVPTRLHRRADVALDVLELGQVPLGDLGDEVVERRLEVMAIGRTFEESLQKAIRQVDPRWTGFEAYWQPEEAYAGTTCRSWSGRGSCRRCSRG